MQSAEQQSAEQLSVPLLAGPHIRRIDGRRGYGWAVRVQRRDIRLERLFSDSAFGDASQALAAAQAWRDQQPWYLQRNRATPNNPGTHIRRGRHGWVIRVQQRDCKLERRFDDAAFGGEVQALNAARAWRDQQPWYRPPGGTRSLRREWPTVAEVARYESLLDVAGRQRQCAFWSASWTDAKGKVWTRKFSVNFWGEDAARQKALVIQARQRQMYTAQCAEPAATSPDHSHLMDASASV